MQLFCFTFAGGTAAFFDKIDECSDDRIEYVKLEYPGHGKRIKEPLCDSFEAVTKDLYRELERLYNGGEYALFGYSMGSLTAVEMYKYIIDRKKLPSPTHIFIAAHAPSLMLDLSSVPEESIDEAVMKRTIDFGAVPEKLIGNKSFWRMYLPIYRADYSIISKYDFEDYSFGGNAPITAFYSETDIPQKSMLEWKKYFDNVELIPFEGNHFFINDHYREMEGIIEERLGVKNAF